MIIITCTIALLIIGVILCKADKYGLVGFIGVVFNSVACFLLLIEILCIPINRYKTESKMQERYAIQETVVRARQNKTHIENATMINEIIKTNRWITSAKYYNTTLFDIWWPDEIDNIELIQ